MRDGRDDAESRRGDRRWRVRSMRRRRIAPWLAVVAVTQRQSPYGMAVDPATNNVSFGDVNNNDTIDEYTLDGQYIREWGGKGTGVGKFQYGSYVAWRATSSRLYVADQWGHNVVADDPNGNELFQFGTQ